MEALRPIRPAKKSIRVSRQKMSLVMVNRIVALESLRRESGRMAVVNRRKKKRKRQEGMGQQMGRRLTRLRKKVKQERRKKLAPQLTHLRREKKRQIPQLMEKK